MADENGSKVSPAIAREIRRALAGALDARMPLPRNEEGGSAVDQRLGTGRRVNEGREVVEFPPHLREWFSSLSVDDVGRLNRVIELKPETIAWIGEKNARELKSLDGAVEFITSSRTAARVLMWVCGAAVTFVGGVVALAKGGYDVFSLLRGPK